MADTRLTRVTVNLTAASTTALDQLVDATGDSRTDVINKALRVYQWFSTTADTGRLRYVRGDGEQETVVIV